MNTVIQKLNDLGYQTIDGAWYDRVADWDSWYKGNVEDFHNYQVWNGQQYVDCKMFTLGMGKKGPEDWANLLMNERVKVTLEEQTAQDFIDEIFTRCSFEVNMNELQELGAALGTYAVVPRGRNIQVNGDGSIVPSADATIDMDFLTAPRIFPLAWTGRRVTECAFSTVINGVNDSYLYLQMHHLANGLYDIENHAYKGGGIGDEVPLADVPGLENIPPVIHTNSDKPFYVIGRLNIANNISGGKQSKPFDYSNNPMGVSVLANAIPSLKACDIVYDAYVNEYKLGKKRVMVQSQLTRLDAGADGKGEQKPVFDSRDVVFHVLPEDMQDSTLIHEIDMALRSGDLSKGVEDMLKILGFKLGFGTNYYKFENGVAVTATETIYDNQDLHESVNKHKIVLRALLEELCRILLRMGNTYMGLKLNEDTPITIDLDDSVFVNKEAQLQDMRLDVQAGLLRPEIYLAQKYAVTEDEARRMMPGMEDLTAQEDNQDEVE